MANLIRGFAPYVPGKRAFKPIDKTGTVNVSVTPTLTAVGFGNNYSTLAVSVRPTLTAVGDVFPIKGTVDHTIVLTSTTAADVIRTGTLAVSVTPTITANGAYGQNATLTRQLVLTTTTYGSPENKGTLDRSIQPGFTLFSTTSGKVSPTSGGVNQTLALTLTGVGGTTSISGTLTNTFTLTSATAETRLARLLGSDTMPAMTGTAVSEVTPPNENDLPALTSDATLLNGAVLDAVATMPAMTGEADDGIDGLNTLPAATISATLNPGRVGAVDETLPALVSTAVLEGPITMDTAADLPQVLISARLTNDGVTLSSSELPALTGAATALPGNVANVALLLPALSSAGSLAEIGATAQASDLPAFYLVGQMHNGAPVTYNPFTMNTENYGVTQYTNYDFHSVFTRGGKYYGANSTGIYELVGANDAGTAIAANFKLGVSDFGSADLKRAPAVYLGYVGGDLTIDVAIDGQTATRQYTIDQISHTSGVKRGRAKPGRGLKSRYWQFGASNVLGSDFEIDTLGVYVQRFDRKAQ